MVGRRAYASLPTAAPRFDTYARFVAVLILLNGPPAGGKSTIAQQFVDSRPLTLNLDVDVIRGLLGNWLAAPIDAGVAARALALAMAETHLNSGRDVIVPQFLGRVDFLEELAKVAQGAGAEFLEVVLMIDRASALEAFAERRGVPSTQTHRDAAALVDRSNDADPIGAMYDALVRLVEQRPATMQVGVVRGDIARTFERFIEALGIDGP